MLQANSDYDAEDVGTNPCSDDPSISSAASASVKQTIHIGFTGTREGMTDAQYNKVDTLIRAVSGFSRVVGHHGDCVGSDAQFHDIVRKHGGRIIVHPPENDSMRAFKEGFYAIRPPKPYIDRNHDIVDESDGMIGIPSGKIEVLRSGTWATIRYSKKSGKPLIIYYPDGETEEQ